MILLLISYGIYVKVCIRYLFEAVSEARVQWWRAWTTNNGQAMATLATAWARLSCPVSLAATLTPPLSTRPYFFADLIWYLFSTALYRTVLSDSNSKYFFLKTGAL